MPKNEEGVKAVKKVLFDIPNRKGWRLMEYFMVAYGSPHPWTDAPVFMEGNEKHYLTEIMGFLDTVKDEDLDRIMDTME